ncbi:uncharacterized protein LOC115891064 [Sitophilus oryzae]|uniref:Uncharacterized protein LOC115891064 n=1 Tax=Sitophilus oryzae TaxID=7048 RepID=A0A6J2YVV9_SITOR|nr:uncharacterized protein LOC115891064 [Sitophilus oryzae]
MEDLRDDQKNFFRSGVCHYCKKICLPITRCKSCKILAYCCKDHQVKDWKSHKRLCQVIANEEPLPMVLGGFESKLNSWPLLASFKFAGPLPVRGLRFFEFLICFCR